MTHIPCMSRARAWARPGPGLPGPPHLAEGSPSNHPATFVPSIVVTSSAHLRFLHRLCFLHTFTPSPHLRSIHRLRKLPPLFTPPYSPPLRSLQTFTSSPTCENQTLHTIAHTRLKSYPRRVTNTHRHLTRSRNKHKGISTMFPQRIQLYTQVPTYRLTSIYIYNRPTHVYILSYTYTHTHTPTILSHFP